MIHEATLDISDLFVGKGHLQIILTSEKVTTCSTVSFYLYVILGMYCLTYGWLLGSIGRDVKNVGRQWS